MTAFVPAYRCGAVPDFHRVPFSLQFLKTDSKINIRQACFEVNTNLAADPVSDRYVTIPNRQDMAVAVNVWENAITACAVYL
jgi:hypothetical protein